MSAPFTRRSRQRSTTRELPEWRYPSIKPRRFNPTPTSVVSQKSLDHRGGLLSGSNGGGAGARGHRNVKVSPGPAVKYPTRRGRGGGPQATDSLTTGARPAAVGGCYVKKR